MVGICFVSAFTASLTTELTVREITGGIRGVNDLVDKRVVTVGGTTAAQYLTDRRIDFDAMDTVDDAFARLDDGRADAMVFDSPVLHHHIEVTGSDRLALIGNVFQREDYGIALPTGSTLRKPVNSSLLEMRADGTYDRITSTTSGESASAASSGYFSVQQARRPQSVHSISSSPRAVGAGAPAAAVGGCVLVAVAVVGFEGLGLV